MKTEAVRSTAPAGGLTFVLHRPYFDLESEGDGPLLRWAPVVAYQALHQDGAVLGLQRVLSPHYRASLIRQSGLRQYAVGDPRRVNGAYRSEPWSHVCELVDAFSDLSAGFQIRVARVLTYLGFYRLVLRLIDEPSPADIAGSEEGARLGYLRAFARNMLLEGETPAYRPDDLEAIVVHSRARTYTRFYAAIALLVHYAKGARNLDRIRELRVVMTEYIDNPVVDRGTFSYLMDLSRFFRSASYLPFLEGRRDQVVMEMDRAESIARELRSRATSWTERTVADENLHPVLESRMREAEWLGDGELALTRIREVLTFDPCDSKARLELGELLFQRRHFEEAAIEFERAARYGPPGTAPAHYLAGCCYERLGEWERACDAYMSALRTDPNGISTTAALARAAHHINLSPLVKWCEANATRLSREANVAVADRLLLVADASVGGQRTAVQA